MGKLTTAVILAGGKGTRLRAITRAQLAKPAVEVCGKPFIVYVIEQLREQHINRIILALGYRAESIVKVIKLWNCSECEVFCERVPLGTAGALVQMVDSLPERFYVLNGDTYSPDFDFLRMAEFHILRRADVTVALGQVSDSKDFGCITLNGDGKVAAFVEKGVGGKLVNRGIYLMEKSVLVSLPRGRFLSLEKDLLPTLIESGRKVYGFMVQGRFFDIGTPERLFRFEEYVRNTIVPIN